jgi:oligopeptide transport system substrate-binding protein
VLRSGSGARPTLPRLGSGNGGTLRLLGAEPSTWDPALVGDSVSAEYVVEIFSGLVSLDARLQVVPDLAERWETSQDGTTYTFFLRSALFHDGRAVTAEDVKYSLERACSPSTGSTVAGVYLGDIVGANEMLAGEAAGISGVEVIDAHTVRIRIDAPKAYFLAKLTYSTAFVVDRRNVEQADWSEKPNGTGPFRLGQHDQQQIVLVRNEQYYREVPALERVEFTLTGGSSISMYENGELDLVWVDPADIERVLDPDNPLHAELSIVPQLDVQYLGFDVTQPPFDDVKVRQAFALAIDRPKIVDVVLKGMATAAEGILPPGVPGYTRQGPLLEFDPQRARGLLSESGYADVVRSHPVKLSVRGHDGHLSSVDEAVVAMCRDNLGVEITVEQVEKLDEARPAFFRDGWIMDYPDPEDVLDIKFHSRTDPKDTTKDTMYSNPWVDELLANARVEQSAERRMGIYKQVEELIVADAPWVPLCNSVDYVLTKPNVKGAVYASAIYPWLGSVHIED